ncbi:DUF1987 domain-containing protein [Herminiimonas arsenitoxidans]|uniref:DUF1987 domain-containing protein n=1 Tax=Herminiimonas arsenitoxidans TaxID=1809410 RepID=UPI0009704A6B|nr:DUF1987 domain-containing protein [Herminiimonas arsenitoxidans]
MNNLYIPASSSSPEVDFRFDEHRLLLKGEAYPENAAVFWGAIIASLHIYLAQVSASQQITVQVALSYFNSSSTKMLFSLFSALNDKAQSGNAIILDWYHDEEDETIFEFGQEIHEDFPELTFNDHAVRT